MNYQKPGAITREDENRIICTALQILIKRSFYSLCERIEEKRI